MSDAVALQVVGATAVPPLVPLVPPLVPVVPPLVPPVLPLVPLLPLVPPLVPVPLPTVVPLHAAAATTAAAQAKAVMQDVKLWVGMDCNF